jgi:hypothetical protein
VTSPTTFFASLLGAAALSLTGHSAAAAPTAHKETPPQTISVVAHPTNLLFIAPSGQTFPFPTGPLAPGTRILGSESITQDAVAVGNDFEQCTVSFNLNVLCDDTVVFDGGDQLRVSWALRWPSTGAPSSWSGPIIGGSGLYDGARGQFQAATNRDSSIRLTATFTTTS